MGKEFGVPTLEEIRKIQADTSLNLKNLNVSLTEDFVEHSKAINSLLEEISKLMQVLKNGGKKINKS